MHELSIVSIMLDKILKTQVEQNLKSIRGVQIVIGVLSGVEVDSIEQCFKILTQDWIPQPTLDIIVEPAEFNCHQCHAQTSIFQMDLICSSCGSSEGNLNSKKGKSLYISEIEGET